MHEETDVTIIGAGSAGLIAALILARSGCDVTVLELKKRGKVGDKVCGDALRYEHAMFLKETARLTFPAPRDVMNTAHKVLFNINDEKVHVWNQQYLLVDRFAFGQSLLTETETFPNIHLLFERMAVETPSGEGVQETANRVYYQKTGEEGLGLITSRVIIDCSGKNRWSARKGALSSIAKRGKNALSYRSLIEFESPHSVPEDELHFIYLDSIPLPGYGWFFPKGDRFANVGLFRVPRGLKGRADGVVDEIVKGYCKAPYRIIDGRYDSIADGIPVALEPVANCLRAGEAAGHVSALNGEGLGFSFMSGYYAAKHALYLLGKEGLSKKEYADAVNRGIVKELILDYAMAGYFRKCGFTAFRRMVESGIFKEAAKYMYNHHVVFWKLIRPLFSFLFIPRAVVALFWFLYYFLEAALWVKRKPAS